MAGDKVTVWDRRIAFAAKFDESDIGTVLDALLVEARDGDIRAIELFLKYRVGSPKQQRRDPAHVGIDYSKLVDAESCVGALQQIAQAEADDLIDEEKAESLSQGVERMARVLSASKSDVDDARGRPVNVIVQTITPPEIDIIDDE